MEKIELIISNLDHMIENMTAERHQYLGRAKQLDDDISRLIYFKSSLQREGDNNENNDQDTV